jgi:hypothetical protein
MRCGRPQVRRLAAAGLSVPPGHVIGGSIWRPVSTVRNGSPRSVSRRGKSRMVKEPGRSEGSSSSSQSMGADTVAPAARGEPEPGASTVTARRARKVSRAGSSTRYANAALRAGFNRYRTFAPTPNTTSVTPPLDTPEMAAPCCCYPAGRSAVIGQAGNAAAVPCTECRRPRPKVAEPARRRPFTSRAGEDGRGGRDDGAWVFVDAQIG